MRLIVLLFLCVILGRPVAAQHTEERPSPAEDYRHAFGAWGGLSFASPGWWGVIREREVFLVGVRYRRMLRRTPTASVAYTFDLIPAAAVTKTPTRTQRQRLCCSDLPRTLRRELESQTEVIEPATAFGFGVTPLGIQLELFRDNPVHFALGAAGGLLFFDRDVPNLDTRKMNFTATLHAGVRIPLLQAWELTAGYTFHHLSNAGTGTSNPGLDSSMFYLGWMHR